MIGIKPEVRPIETVTPIKPSEAIRLGCLLYPEQYFEGLSDGGQKACVLGAMFAGFAGDEVRYGFTCVLRHGPIQEAFDNTAGLPCPEACGPMERGILATPAHLNDDHRWSRERIADWLESIGL